MNNETTRAACLSRKRISVLSLLFILASIPIAFYFACPKEPAYDGRSLTYWLKAYDRGRGYAGSGTFDPNQYAKMHASQMALMAIGTNAIPILIKMFQANDARPGRKVLY